MGAPIYPLCLISHMLSLSRFTRSVRFAWDGLRRTAASENSFRIHLTAAAMALFLTAVLGLRAIEAAIIVLVIAIVLTMELVNTVVERFVGILEPRVHSYVRVIKDILAAAVLVNVVAAIVIGLIIFLPYLRNL